jgi:2-iminoacetate synthase ThiH
MGDAGLKLAQVALRFGANDFGSTMIERTLLHQQGKLQDLEERDHQRDQVSGFHTRAEDTVIRY